MKTNRDIFDYVVARIMELEKLDAESRKEDPYEGGWRESGIEELKMLKKWMS